ncbi:hypothetical protein L6164_021750 [Bauhinia variegata]|uniref:Uncharacterized protein n=1 Tax=Bauhinia variegata TaxID=167791 RepID=A0ACB9MEH0_BAUVA|nr:hypothetical protein L6164_021750 [Bauhinia variegata]
MSIDSEEVGLILRAMGFDNSTRIYLAAGELFGGDRFMKPFRSLFPHLENHSSVEPSDELVENTRGLGGSAVDYMVCLLSDIFMPTLKALATSQTTSLDIVSIMDSELQSDLIEKPLLQFSLIGRMGGQQVLRKLSGESCLK